MHALGSFLFAMPKHREGTLKRLMCSHTKETGSSTHTQQFAAARQNRHRETTKEHHSAEEQDYLSRNQCLPKITGLYLPMRHSCTFAKTRQATAVLKYTVLYELFLRYCLLSAFLERIFNIGSIGVAREVFDGFNPSKFLHSAYMYAYIQTCTNIQKVGWIPSSSPHPSHNFLAMPHVFKKNWHGLG